MPVQFIPAYNALVTEALEHAESRTFDGVPVRVLTLEHLIAIMLQTNRPKDRQRLAMLVGNAGIDESRLHDILTRHQLLTAWETLSPKP